MSINAKRRYNFEIQPNGEQKQKLIDFTSYDRGLWNLLLSENIRHYQHCKNFIFYHEMTTLIKELKQFEEFDWLKEMDSAAAQQCAKSLDKALNDCFDKSQKDKAFPKFKISYKKKKLLNDSYTTTFTNNNIEIKNNKVKLPKIGWIKIRLHRKLVSKIKNVTIRKEHNCWIISFTQEKEINQPKKILKTVNGYDINSQHTIVDEKIKVANPKYLKQNEFKLKELQRQLARRKKGSNNWYKTKERITKLHGYIVRSRLDFAHKLSYSIAKSDDIVLFEDLNVKSMQQFNGRMVHDNIMGLLPNLVQYKVEERGGLFHKIDRFAKSTGICNKCGYDHKLTLKDRKFVCENCGELNDRDHSSSHSIKQTGITELLAGGLLVRVSQPTACLEVGVKTKVFERKVSKLPKEGKNKRNLAKIS